mmetsp:Transcript_32011/g.52889  ORF Transcript_32011/g.52889 Transcript_32011/m.52889 type:complete len:255 (+) Transcript_32011:57-821(+)|eukprot:CAMPEP_0119005902 /NCGR_PEP_ID=MMETSP1176-20130426/1998_1 /TAXON_ID=265551 /ORGANISM="Synedropsis recta cf, Strain CCMP1620" /LENGTH=254 /DNA_ID=CAMNT_0006957761 /DNA_START=57 /DNA_END=821 /DNA_ORIENTATION=+
MPSNNNSNSGSGGMASSIALQIQDRALLLASERGLRDAAAVVRDQVLVQHKDQSKTHQVLRHKLLSELRTRHGFELELYCMKEQHAEHELSVQKRQQEAQVLNEQAIEMQDSWKRSVDQIFAPHQAKRRRYQDCLEQCIRKRQRHSQRQQQKLDFLQKRAREMSRDQEDMLSQRVDTLARTEATDAREEEEDEQVSSLALQIKATLSKRSTLRRSLQAAQEAYRKVNDEMTKWENACTQSSSANNTGSSGTISY